MIKKVSFYCFVLIATTALFGCGTLEPVGVASQGVRHQYLKNYILHTKQKVYVGEPVIQVKDYYIETLKVPKLEPSQSFSAHVFGHPDTQYVAGQKYDVIGQATFGDFGTFNAIQANDGVLYFVDKFGLFKKVGIGRGNHYDIGMAPITLSPASATMNPVFEETVSVAKGYENFELLYSGMDKNSMAFTYREYSPEGLARVAFYQTLTYDSQAKSIRFKKFKLDIIEANSEGIAYTVVEE